MNQKINSLKNSAKTRNIKLDINLEEYKHLISLGCQYCGESLLDKGGSSLDRLDSSKPYTSENVVPCCKVCNIAKNNMSVDEFINWINKVYNKTKADIELVKQLVNNNFDYKQNKKQLVKEFKISKDYRWIK